MIDLILKSHPSCKTSLFEELTVDLNIPILYASNHQYYLIILQIDVATFDFWIVQWQEEALIPLVWLLPMINPQTIHLSETLVNNVDFYNFRY